jgi:hypothetical protein
MIEAIAGMILLVLSLAAMYVAKIKKASRTEQKLEAQEEVMEDVIGVHEAIQDRSSDTAERDGVRDKYTRPS